MIHSYNSTQQDHIGWIDLYQLLVGADVNKYKESDPWSDTNHYWTEVNVRYSDDNYVIFLVDVASRYRKITCGIEASNVDFLQSK